MPAVRSIDPRAREALLHELKTLARRLAAELGAGAVYLFGSLARQEQHEGSDIDLLVVVDYQGRAIDMIGEILRRTDLPVEPLVVRTHVLAKRLSEGHPLLTRAMSEAIQLYPQDFTEPQGTPTPLP